MYVYQYEVHQFFSLLYYLAGDARVERVSSTRASRAMEFIFCQAQLFYNSLPHIILYFGRFYNSLLPCFFICTIYAARSSVFTIGFQHVKLKIKKFLLRSRVSYLANAYLNMRQKSTKIRDKCISFYLSIFLTYFPNEIKI